MPPESLERPLKGRDWRDDAKCKGLGTETFFHGSRTDDVHGRNKRAVEFCRNCPVKEPCMEEGVAVFLQTGYAFGVWGGFTRNQIQGIARGRRGF